MMDDVVEFIIGTGKWNDNAVFKQFSETADFFG